MDTSWLSVALQVQLAWGQDRCRREPYCFATSLPDHHNAVLPTYLPVFTCDPFCKGTTLVIVRHACYSKGDHQVCDSLDEFQKGTRRSTRRRRQRRLSIEARLLLETQLLTRSSSDALRPCFRSQLLIGPPLLDAAAYGATIKEDWTCSDQIGLASTQLPSQVCPVFALPLPRRNASRH